MSHEYPHVLDPETLVGNLGLPGLGRRIGRTTLAATLDKSCRDLRRVLVEPEQDVSVIIQARRRPYPKSLAAKRGNPQRVMAGFMHTIDGIDRQDYPRERIKEIIVLGDEDLTLPTEVVERFPSTDVRLLSVERGVNHAQALNQGVGALAAEASDIVMITEAGARYATDSAFRAAESLIGETPVGKQSAVVGAFGTRLADGRASIGESSMYLAGVKLTRPIHDEVDYSPKPGVGFMAADRAAYETATLKANPFDESYGRGGGDSKWAEDQQDALGARGTIVFHPALSIQYAEGLNPLQLFAQLREWRAYAHPNEY